MAGNNAIDLWRQFLGDDGFYGVGIVVIQSGSWFVQQEEDRVLDHSSGQCRSLLLPARQLTGFSIRIFAHSQVGQNSLAFLIRGLGGNSGQTRYQGHIGGDGNQWQKIELLKDEAQGFSLKSKFGDFQGSGSRIFPFCGER